MALRLFVGHGIIPTDPARGQRRARRSRSGGGSVTERLLYMPVPALLGMEDVNRVEVAPWIVDGHCEGHSKA